MEKLDEVALIARLEELLASAKDGKLIGMAYAVVTPNQQRTGWIGSEGTEHVLGTTISLLSHRYISAMVNNLEQKNTDNKEEEPEAPDNEEVEEEDNTPVL